MGHLGDLNWRLMLDIGCWRKSVGSKEIVALVDVRGLKGKVGVSESGGTWHYEELESYLCMIKI